MGNAAKKLNEFNSGTATAQTPPRGPLGLLRRSIDALKSNHTLWHWTIPLVLVMSFTVDRTVHFLWAALFWLLSIVILSGAKKIANRTRFASMVDDLTASPGVPRWHCLALNLYVIYLGSWLPDIDWLFMQHRSPISHSVGPYFLMLAVVKKYESFGNREWNWKLLCLFGYALASHLLTDIPPGGNVISLPAWLDMPYLAINGLATFVLAFRLQKQRLSYASKVNQRNTA